MASAQGSRPSHACSHSRISDRLRRVDYPGCSMLLAVDEDVVGGVGDGDGGGGLRVAGARWLHAAVGVKAEHLHDVRQQSGGGAFLCGVEVQLGDVAVAVGVLGDDLASDAAAVWGL